MTEISTRVGNIKRVFRGIVFAFVTYVSATSLQGCIFGDGCATPVDESKLFVDPNWVKNNLDKDAFNFDCTGIAFPPPTGTDGKIKVDIYLLVKQIYLAMGNPTMKNFAMIRGDALALAKTFAKGAIQMQNPGVKDVTDIICKETKVNTPDFTGLSCKTSDNSDQQGAPGAELPPGGGEPPPSPSPASISIPAPIYLENQE